MFDLHLHSLASDGLADLDTVARRIAERPDLELVALTDHDAIADSVRLAAIEPRAWVGSELTTKHGTRTIDLLALNLRAECDELNDYLVARKAERVLRFDAFGAALAAAGWSWDPPAAVYDLPQLAQPHVVRELRRHADNLDRFEALGIPRVVTHRSDDDEIYRQLLSPLRVDVGSVVLSVVDAIAMVHRAGGLAVVAHPWIAPYDRGSATRTKARRAIASWAAAGLDGIEVFHEAQTDPAVISELLARATEHRLLVTAGSDDHSPTLEQLGAFSPDSVVGRGWLADLRAAAERRRCA